MFTVKASPCTTSTFELFLCGTQKNAQNVCYIKQYIQNTYTDRYIVFLGSLQLFDSRQLENQTVGSNM